MRGRLASAGSAGRDRPVSVLAADCAPLEIVAIAVVGDRAVSRKAEVEQLRGLRGEVGQLRPDLLPYPLLAADPSRAGTVRHFGF